MPEEKQSGGTTTLTSLVATVLSFVVPGTTPSGVLAVCLAGALAVSLSAQNAVADLQRVGAADVDAAPDGPAERRVCLNRSAYVLAVQGVLRDGAFRGEGRVIWEEEPSEWVALQVDPDEDGDNWQIFHIDQPGCFIVRATDARVRVYLLRVGVDWGDRGAPPAQARRNCRPYFRWPSAPQASSMRAEAAGQRVFAKQDAITLYATGPVDEGRDGRPAGIVEHRVVQANRLVCRGR